ncbi:MAG: hypothetical protein ACTHJX_14310 [Terriglobales bacterium]
MSTSPAVPHWKAALLTVRTQIADYEREGTSTPGKLKRAARLRTSRLALRDFAETHAQPVAELKQLLQEVEAAEKDDNWPRIAELVRQLLTRVDGWLGHD